MPVRAQAVRRVPGKRVDRIGGNVGPVRVAAIDASRRRIIPGPCIMASIAVAGVVLIVMPGVKMMAQPNADTVVVAAVDADRIANLAVSGVDTERDAASRV